MDTAKFQCPAEKSSSRKLGFRHTAFLGVSHSLLTWTSLYIRCKVLYSVPGFIASYPNCINRSSSSWP